MNKTEFKGLKKTLEKYKTVKFGEYEFKVKQILETMDINLYIKTITDSCYNDEKGINYCEREFYKVVLLLKLFTDISLPTIDDGKLDLTEIYNVSINSGLYKKVKENIPDFILEKLEFLEENAFFEKYKETEYKNNVNNSIKSMAENFNNTLEKVTTSLEKGIKNINDPKIKKVLDSFSKLTKK